MNIVKRVVPGLAVLGVVALTAQPASAVDWTALDRTSERYQFNIPGEGANPLVGESARSGSSAGPRGAAGVEPGKVPAATPKVVSQVERKLDRITLFSLLRYFR